MHGRGRGGSHNRCHRSRFRLDPGVDAEAKPFQVPDDIACGGALGHQANFVLATAEDPQQRPHLALRREQQRAADGPGRGGGDGLADQPFEERGGVATTHPDDGVLFPAHACITGDCSDVLLDAPRCGLCRHPAVRHRPTPLSPPARQQLC